MSFGNLVAARLEAVGLELAKRKKQHEEQVKKDLVSDIRKGGLRSNAHVAPGASASSGNFVLSRPLAKGVAIANIHSMQDYELNLDDVLPPDWIPHGYPDIFSMASKKGKDPVMVLLTKLNFDPNEVEAIGYYMDAFITPKREAKDAPPSPSEGKTHKFTAFSGKGHSMVNTNASETKNSPFVSSPPSSAVTADTTPTSEAVSALPACPEAEQPPAPPPPLEDFVFDSSKPGIKVQMQLHDNSRVEVELNTDHTIADLRRHLVM